MAKIFDWNGRKGSFIESAGGKVSTPANTKWLNTEKGLAQSFDGETSTLRFSEDITLDITSDYTIEFWCRGVLEGFNAVLGQYSSPLYNQITFNGGYIYVEAGINNDIINILLNSSDTKWHHYIITLNAGLIGAYQDGVQLSAPVYTFSNNFTFDEIGCRGDVGAARVFNGEIGGVRIYNSVLTQPQINTLYSEFVNATNLAENKDNFYYPKSTDLSGEADTHLTDNFAQGDITDDGNWTLGTGWSFVSGVLICDGSQSSFTASYHGNELPSPSYNRKYKVVYTISSISSGGVSVNLGGYTNTAYNTTTGTFTEEISVTNTSSNLRIAFQANSSFVGSVTLISVKEITGLQAAYNMIPQDGELVDISGNGNTGTVYGCSQTVDGLKFDGVDDRVTLNDPLNAVGDYTWCFYLNNDTGVSSNLRLLSNSISSSGYEIYLYGSGGNLKVRVYTSGGNEENIIATIPLEWKSLIITKSSNTYTAYVNGIPYTPVIFTNNILATTDDMNIGSTYFGSFALPMELSFVRFYNRVLSESEIQSINNKWAKQVSYRNTFKYEGVGNVPFGWTIGTGTYEIGAISNIRGSGELIVNGTFDTDSDWTKQTGWTISGGLANCDGTQTGNSSIYQTTNTSDSTCKIEFTVSNYSAGNVRVVLGSDGISDWVSANGDYEFILVETSGANERVYLQGDADFIGSVDNISMQFYNPLKLQNGDKYVECTSAGTAYFQSNQAYGTWEFEFNKKSGSATSYIYFVNNVPDVESDQGYYLLFSNLEAIKFAVRGISTYFSTADSYFSLGVTYGVKITRDINNEFTFYIKGGSFGDDYILMSAAGGSGTNPVTNTVHTTSKYVVLDYDDLTSISNFKFTKGIVV